MRSILEVADLVKFAKWASEGEEARERLARAIGFVERTRPVAVDTSNADPRGSGGNGDDEGGRGRAKQEKVEAAI